MADLKELADQAAGELLKSIRDQAGRASDLKLLQLAQAYSMVVSTEVSTRLADEGAAAAAEYESALGVGASISSISSISPE
jgi:aminoglycoside phosphotransferase family enzyme